MTKLVCDVANCERPAQSRGWCSAHYRRWHVHGDVRAEIPVPRPRSDLGKPRGPQDVRYLDPDERSCKRCGQVKPLTAFGPSQVSALGRKYRCRDCDAEKARHERANDSPEQRQRRIASAKRSSVKGRYGEAGLLALERINNGAGCDVCSTTKPGARGMAIDHCHASGLVRGILCKDCNLILGWVNDDPTRLDALAEYLRSARLRM